MKGLNSLTIIAIFAVLISSCAGGSGKETASEDTAEEATAETSDVAGTFTIDTDVSEVAWKGEVAGVYGHNGVINVQEGTFTVAKGMITSGEVVIDMASIQPLDTASYEASGKTPQDLVDHLSTGDFFLVEEFPTASFVVKSHTGSQLVGDLTIRGNTNEETVDISSLEITEGGLTGAGILVFDRQKYDVTWEHYIQDYVLSDDIELTLNIVDGSSAL
ncbi:MAG: YceI family protein [Bacteroidota bacterium]